MKELSERGNVSLTGFEDYELQGLIDQYQNRLADILDYTPPEPQPDNEQEEEPPADATFSMIFSIPEQYKGAVDAYLEQDNARANLSAAIMESIKGED